MLRRFLPTVVAALVLAPPAWGGPGADAARARAVESRARTCGVGSGPAPGRRREDERGDDRRQEAAQHAPSPYPAGLRRERVRDPELLADDRRVEPVLLLEPPVERLHRLDLGAVERARVRE